MREYFVHGTCQDLVGDLRHGSFNSAFWYAEAPAARQNYIVRDNDHCIAWDQNNFSKEPRCDEAGKPVLLYLTAGQVSDYKGARALLPALPQAGALIADRGYDSAWFRQGLAERGITPCIPSRKNRKYAFDYDKALYRQRPKVENMLAKLKDWRRVATRYDRCAHTFFSAVCLAAAVAFYLKE